ASAFSVLPMVSFLRYSRSLCSDKDFPRSRGESVLPWVSDFSGGTPRPSSSCRECRTRTEDHVPPRTLLERGEVCRPSQDPRRCELRGRLLGPRGRCT